MAFPKPRTDWPPERIETLTRLWMEGHTGSHIAKTMGGGLSRSAILGKVHRLGLEREKEKALANKAEANRAKAKIQRKRQPGTTNRQPRRKTGQNANVFAYNLANRLETKKHDKPAPEPALREIPATAKPWLQRRVGECAFPVAGVGADTFSCCQPTGGATYCPGHHRVMYSGQTAAEKRNEARYIDRLARRSA